MELNIQQIQELLPHRFPFLLVDKIVSCEPGKGIVGQKNVTINEPFFQGHFPGHPIMPGVLIIEAMAQVGGLYALSCNEVDREKVTYFVGIDQARFRRPVVPGDVLMMELTLISCRRGIYTFAGKATVDGKVVAEAELKATFADR